MRDDIADSSHGSGNSPSNLIAPNVREKFGGDLLKIVVLVALPIGFASSWKTFSDGDVSWHVAAGRWMLQHHQIPTADPFSFTAAGQPWIAMEWLAELIYAGAYNLAGYAGLAAIVAMALVALHAVVLSHIRHKVGPIGIAAAIVGMDIVLGAFMLARPHVLVWPILAGWTMLLLRSIETGRPPPLWSALLLVLWTNIHASFPLAIIIAGALGLDAVRAARWKNWRQWALFLAISVAALMLNANGARGIAQPFYVARLDMLPTIVEWQPSSPHLTPQFYLVLLLTLGAMLWRGAKVPLGRLLLLLLLLAMAFSQLRHQSWLAIVAALVLPPLLGTGGRFPSSVRPFLLAAFAAVVLRALIPLQPPENMANPRSLIAAVPPALRTQPMLNGYTFGGPLILAGMRPYIDGRAEMYGDRFFADYVKISDGDQAAFDRAVARYDIRWTMLPHEDQKLIRTLDSSKNWRRAYSDRVGVIHVRLRRE
jgi:hypothetical protein